MRASCNAGAELDLPVHRRTPSAGAGVGTGFSIPLLGLDHLLLLVGVGASGLLFISPQGQPVAAMPLAGRLRWGSLFGPPAVASLPWRNWSRPWLSRCLGLLILRKPPPGRRPDPPPSTGWW